MSQTKNNVTSVEDITSILMEELKHLQSLKTNINIDESNIFLLVGDGDIKYPHVCSSVDGQSEPACKLTEPKDLPQDIQDLYLIDPGLANIYSTQSTLKVGVQACAYSRYGKSGTVTVSGMSAMKFNTTRPSTPNSQHNFGKAFDVKLQGKMKSNGSNYDRAACAYLCLYCVEAGASKVFFSDQDVVDAVNKVASRKICQNIPNHENHIHMDCR